MVGTTAQMISLVSYGNEYLINDNKDTDFKFHTTFQFCRFVTFKVKTVHLNEFGTNELIIGDANEWFEYLKKDGCKKMRLFYRAADNKGNMADYMSAGFIGGGGQWLIETIYENKSVFWASRWIVNKLGAQDNRIWEVTYTNVHTGEKPVNMHYDLDRTKKELLDTLREIDIFAKETGRNFWADKFAEAIAELNSDEPDTGYHQDLIIEENYSQTARQMLAGVQKAWVFGGMGWWNDYYYKGEKDQETNVRLSKSLYSLICMSIVAAVNSF